MIKQIYLTPELKYTPNYYTTYYAPKKYLKNRTRPLKNQIKNLESLSQKTTPQKINPL